METQNYNNDKLEFRQIVLAHIKRILEISSHELRDTTTRTIHNNYTEKIEHEDTRKSYISAVENLAYILVPYFDNEMKKVYETCEKIMNGLGYEVKKILKKEFDEIEDTIETNTEKRNLDNNIVLRMKLQYAKKLFVALNLLLKRNDYLKSAVYGEDKDEKAQVDEEDE